MSKMTATELGRRLRHTRERRGLTQVELAHKAHIDRTALNKIEAGSRRVTALELVAIADSLGVQMASFFRDPVPSIVSHRSSQGLDTVDSKIGGLLNNLVEDVELVQRLTPLADSPITAYDWGKPHSAAESEKMAERIRRELDLDAAEPATRLVDRLANISFLVFSQPLGDDTADGGTVVLERGGVSLINSSQKVGRRRLTAVHELCHFLVGDDYTVDWQVANNQEQTEAWFDYVARAVLLPSAGVTELWDQTSAASGVRTAAVMVSSTYRVDMSTLARRLQDLDHVDASTAGDIRGFRTTKADIIELDLNPADELSGITQPRKYQQAILRLIRDEKISRERGQDLLWGLLDEEDIPEPPIKDESAAWGYFR